MVKVENLDALHAKLFGDCFSMEVMTTRIIEEHWKSIVPIDVHAIAKSMGIRVEPLRLSDASVLRLIAEYDFIDGVPVIRINPSASDLRQRFALGHAIGHHVLGYGQRFADSLENFSSDVPDPKEAQANKFAVSLLMPKTAIGYFIDKEKIASVEKLAKKFWVSDSAMVYRLKELGIIS